MNDLATKKILILGSQGMLGQDLVKIFSGLDLILWDKEEIDITDKVQVETKIKDLKPDIIINCAAYTNVDGCESNMGLATMVNGLAVGYLVDFCQQINAVLVQISTDYVFDGKNQGGYAEDSQAFAPVNVYGASKLLAEKAILGKLEKYYLIRTSWLYGQHGKNFVDTILRSAKEKSELKVINDQFGKPTYTIDLAKQILYILDNDLAFGIYHVTNETKAGGITWFDFAQKIIGLAGLKVVVKPCTTAEYPLPAKRPAYSAINNTKLPPLRNWEDALKEYLANG